ncbi:RNA pseudouridine synthase 1 [Iris pallida]|uniref:RNA pseudouridine synthase 1 n=1 Tax=Iris pallida TaxID=29817 RepID=A0AAX6DGT3_IRIPA|nr:RNA pseudouridine synthase 1 [Iris pallida]
MTRIAFQSHPPPAAATRIRTMLAVPGPSSPSLTGAYPKPVSPPYPEMSREVELSRALSAEARSAAYAASEPASESAVVFEDEWFVVVNKPPGIYCETLLSSLSSRPGIKTSKSDLHLANRLDRDTSGLMVITKSNKVAGKFVKAFTNHKVKKTYLALCVGRAPNWARIRIDSGHGRSKFGAWRVYASSDVGRALPGGSMVKQMTTSFNILSINGRGECGDPAEVDTDDIKTVVVQEEGREWNPDEDVEKCDEVLVRAYPESGRTHQIRLHCQYLGMPIRGDVKYGGIHEWKGVMRDGHALHAESISFKHPITGDGVHFRAPHPSWVNESCGQQF